MVFRSRAERTVASLDRVLSADATLARLATLFAEPPRPASPGRSPSVVLRRLLRWPAAPRRRVLLAVAVLAVLGGAVASAVAGLPGLAVVCGVTAGVGAVWSIAEIIGRKMASPPRRRRRLPWAGKARQQWRK